MGRPISLKTRSGIISLHEQGKGRKEIAGTFALSVGAVGLLVKRFKTLGDEGLLARYANCGKPRPAGSNFSYRAVRFLKFRHGEWGAGKIRAEIRKKYPDLGLPTERTVQRWFNWEGHKKSGSGIPKPPREWAKEAHECWQVDAKEMINLADGNRHCWLNIVDEHTGAIIDPPVFPPREDQRGAAGGGTSGTGQGV